MAEPVCWENCLGDFLDVAGLWSFLPLDDLELHLIALLKALIAFATDRAVVNKDIRTIITADESKSLGIIEPLDGTPETRHLLFLRASCYRRFADGRNRREPRGVQVSFVRC